MKSPIDEIAIFFGRDLALPTNPDATRMSEDFAHHVLGGPMMMSHLTVATQTQIQLALKRFQVGLASANRPLRDIVGPNVGRDARGRFAIIGVEAANWPRTASVVIGMTRVPFGRRPVVSDGHCAFALISALVDFSDGRALRLGTLNAAGAIVANAAGRVAFFKSFLAYLAFEAFVPAHARRIFGTKVDQSRLRKRGKCTLVMEKEKNPTTQFPFFFAFGAFSGKRPMESKPLSWKGQPFEKAFFFFLESSRVQV